MADTIIKKDLLQAETERYLDVMPTFLQWVNMRYSSAIKKQGDAVTVQTFPDITLSAGTAGSPIADQDFAITGTNIVADQVKQARISITDFDESVSNLDLHARIARSIAYEVKDDMELYFFGLHTDAIAANELDDGDLAAATNGGAGNAATLTTANVYEAFAAMNKALDDNNATGQRGVFVRPAIKKLLIEKGLASGTEFGYKDGVDGDVPEIAGLKVFVSTNVPAGFMVACDREAMHGVAKYAKVDVREGSDGFYDNAIVESIYGGKVLPNGSKRLVSFAVTNA